MSDLGSFVKRLRDIMRNDAGINGDAQRIEQIAWMLFLKVYDAQEENWDVSCIIKVPKVADKNGESCISILEKNATGFLISSGAYIPS